jgi:hypothetical protein
MAELVYISEEEKRKRRRNMTYTERFRLMMELYKAGMLMKKGIRKSKENGQNP